MKTYSLFIKEIILVLFLSIFFVYSVKAKEFSYSLNGASITDYLNIRSEANINSKKIKLKDRDYLTKDVNLVITGEYIVDNQKWLKVNFKIDKNNYNGYVSDNYVKYNNYDNIYISPIKNTYLLDNKAKRTNLLFKKNKKIKVKKEVFYNGKKLFRILYNKKYYYIESEKVNVIVNKKTPTNAVNPNKVLYKKYITQNNVYIYKYSKTNEVIGDVILSKNDMVDVYTKIYDQTKRVNIGFKHNGKIIKGYVDVKYLSDKMNDNSVNIDNNVSNVESNTNLQDNINVNYKEDLKSKGFPNSYAERLAILKEFHNEYEFVPVFVPYSWEYVISKQSTPGKNLIENVFYDTFKSKDKLAYNEKNYSFKIYDSNRWVSASKEAISFFMDPRNSINEVDIFQFLKLDYHPSQNVYGVEKILQNTALYNLEYELNGEKKLYSETIYEVGKTLNINPYHLAARIKQEVLGSGNFKSKTITGEVKGYEGIYNFYNIGAYHSSDPALNALKFAKGGNDSEKDLKYNLPWDNPYKAIYGGAVYIGENYINRGQNTVYLQKFDVLDTAGKFNHQYMAAVTGAYGEGKKLSDLYKNIKSQQVVFEIPVYQDMPESLSLKPESKNELFNKSDLERLKLKKFYVENYPLYKTNENEFYVKLDKNETKLNVVVETFNDNDVVIGNGLVDILGKNEINLKIVVFGEVERNILIKLY